MGTKDAREALLARLIDHAPTFPPASLPSDRALAEDARAAATPHAFVLARLVWRASALADVASYERARSVVLDAPVSDDPRVEAIETRPLFDPGAAGSGIPPAVTEIYVETPIDDELEDRLDQLAELQLRAKVRCGGEAVPSPSELARFIRACRDRRLVFKATAGLHHAVGGNGEHGFLNLLAAVLFDGAEEAVLAETDTAAFTLDAASFSWRERSAFPDEIARVRRELFHSIGSCSFFEPVEELEALGVLPL
jgi:predicted transcriptional regulator